MPCFAQGREAESARDSLSQQKTPPTVRKTKNPQWLSFQQKWLANLRRELLGTEERFGNPNPEFSTELHQKPFRQDFDDIEFGVRKLLEDENDAKRTLVLDLDETLVHSEFHETRGWITHLRSGTDEFLTTVAEMFEIVIFTSGQREYAEPIINQIDVGRVSHRLYRDSCRLLKGVYVKDLSRLNRDMTRTIIIDNSPEAYVLQPENAIPIKPFFGDTTDLSLIDTLPLLSKIFEDDVSDVRALLKKCHLKGRFATGRCRSESVAGGLPRGLTRTILHPQASPSPPPPPLSDPEETQLTACGSAPAGLAEYFSSAMKKRGKIEHQFTTRELCLEFERVCVETETHGEKGEVSILKKKISQSPLTLTYTSGLSFMSPPSCLSYFPHTH